MPVPAAAAAAPPLQPRFLTLFPPSILVCMSATLETNPGLLSALSLLGSLSPAVVFMLPGPRRLGSASGCTLFMLMRMVQLQQKHQCSQFESWESLGNISVSTV